METSKIYCLKCPITNNVRYVGSTNYTLDKRLYAHIKQNYYTNASKALWIRDLKEKNLIPIIELLQITEKSNKFKAEKHWINYYLDNKADLFNVNTNYYTKN